MALLMSLLLVLASLVSTSAGLGSSRGLFSPVDLLDTLRGLWRVSVSGPLGRVSQLHSRRSNEVSQAPVILGAARSRTFGELGRGVARGVGSILHLLRYQWPCGSAFTIALILVFIYFGLSLKETRVVEVNASELGLNTFGVFSDVATRLAVSPNVDLGSYPDLEPPDETFSLRITPGEPWKGEFALVVLSSPPYWTLDLDDSSSFVFILPEGARLIRDADSSLIADPPGACASWHDGELVRTAQPHIVPDPFETIALCEVPAVGSVEQLFVHLRFEWDNQVVVEGAVGQQRSALRVAGGQLIEPDALPRIGPRVAESLKVSLNLQEGYRLVDSYPAATGGGLEERTWMTSGYTTELDFMIEKPRCRVWVQPVLEGTLLGAGVLLGMLHSLWRRAG